MKRSLKAGFSLVELVVALGIVSFALLSTVALLPLGVKSYKETIDETRAGFILTALEADLRNSAPIAGVTPQRSRLFGLLLPYEKDIATGATRFNSTIISATKNLMEGKETVGLSSAEVIVPLKESARYQASILYTRIPAAQSLTPMEGVLIVNWPPIQSTDPSDLTNTSVVSGFVQSAVAFSVP
ncbi:MAG: prepilin-type N-terminal cleavage/methylation domain-containing protein [Verrucomicrobiota bacterium]